MLVMRGCLFLLSLGATFQLGRRPLKAGLSTYTGPRAAGLQHLLRSGFRPRLMPNIGHTGGCMQRLIILVLLLVSWRSFVFPADSHGQSTVSPGSAEWGELFDPPLLQNRLRFRLPPLFGSSFLINSGR